MQATRGTTTNGHTVALSYCLTSGHTTYNWTRKTKWEKTIIIQTHLEEKHEIETKTQSSKSRVPHQNKDFCEVHDDNVGDGDHDGYDNDDRDPHHDYDHDNDGNNQDVPPL